MKKIFLFGYYGCGNLGDELLCTYYTNLLTSYFPGIKVIVLTNKPWEQETEKGYATISRWNLWRLRKMMSPGDLLVGGGGSIFQDLTSKRSLFYYLALLQLANRCGMEIILAGQGLGPLSSLGRRLTGSYLNLAVGISCRDQWSLAMLAEMGVTKPHLYLGVDPLWDWPRLSLSHLPGQRRNSVLGFFFRKAAQSKKNPLLTALKWKYKELRLIVLSPEDYSEAEIVAEEIGVSPPLLITDFTDLVTIAHELTLVIGEKLHGLLLAARCGVPGIGLSNDPKIKAFCQQMEVPCFSWKDPFMERLVLMAIDEMLSDLSSSGHRLVEQSAKMQAEAREERDWFLRIIEQTLNG